MPNNPNDPNSFSYTSHELGFPGPEPSPPGQMPPGDGRYTTPHFLTFSGLIQTAARTYKYTFDESLRASRTNALAMRRDAVLWGTLRARQMPTAQLSWHLEARDETDPAETEAAKLITEIIEDIPRFQILKMQLLEALWFGRYAVEMAYEWQMHKGRQVLKVRDFIPINGDKLRFKWDGTPGVLVFPSFPGSTEATDWGMAHFLTPDERQQYIIHHHEPDDADWTEGDLAGSIMGVGLRGRLYWFWWLKSQIVALLMNYLERFANGLTIYYYEASNPQAKQEAIDAAKQQFTNVALLYPRFNSVNPDTNSVERLEVSTASPTLLQNLVTEYFDNVMTRCILGQTLSSNAEATGLGSGVADLHGETLAEIIKYDAVNLAETLQIDLVNVLYRYNAPGIRPGKFSFEVDTPNAKELMEYANAMIEWGMSLDEAQVYKISQWQKPKPGGGIVSKIGAMQAAAVQGVPTGVPVSGQAGPPGAPGPDGQQAVPSSMAGPPSGNGYPAPSAMAYRRGKPIQKRRLMRV